MAGRPAAFSTPMAAGNLGAALASYGDQARADRMFAQGRDLLNPAGPEPQVFRADYGTRLRDAAALLALSAEAGQAASQVAAIPDVRAVLVDFQRRFAVQEPGAVLDGRQAVRDKARQDQQPSRPPEQPPILPFAGPFGEF